MRSCKLCLLPDVSPRANFDKDGICEFCRNRRPVHDLLADELRGQRERDLERALSDCRGKGPYDALVCLSGGKDSVYLLHRLKVDYGLTVLAFTTDVNIPPVAWSNIR